MSLLRFTKIVILESLPEGDLKTGKSLAEDLPYVGIQNNLPIPVEYFGIETRSDLIIRLHELRSDAEQGTWPILQIDAHGSAEPSGIMLSSGDLVTWLELEDELRQLNIAARCNLLLVSATCFGIFSASTVAVANRAPFWAAVGPIAESSAGEILSTLRAFYVKLLAQAEADEIVSTFVGTGLRAVTAEYMFVQSYKYLVENVNSAIPPSEKEFNSLIRQYFMVDLYPENQAKFTVAYERIRL